MNVLTRIEQQERAFSSDPTPFVRTDEAGNSTLILMVDGVHCAGCIAKIEKTLNNLPEIDSARLNMSTKRLTVSWQGEPGVGAHAADAVTKLGYPAAPFEPGAVSRETDTEGRKLLIALAVAGFAASNVMLLSVSVWAGLFSGMESVTRELFHWVSALIALPAVAFAGSPFFRSAAAALRGRSMNMDVPISLAVILASLVSLQQTMAGGLHAYFDASVTLLFFLLIGRYLDHRARASARSTAEHLLALQGSIARVLVGGQVRSMPARDVRVGMKVLVAAGERIPVDGVIAEGRTDLDTSLVTGETTPRASKAGDPVHAGMLNVSGALTVTTRAAGDDTLLAEIVHLMETAEQGQAKYVRIADRIARFYSPAVHILALSTFLGWLLLVGAPWQQSLLVAVAVLIITCPCALGLAVPVVQVVASGQLLRRGVLVKSGDALERMAAVDTIVFDKTGTLTLGRPELVEDQKVPDTEFAAAVSLAQSSRHPLCHALAEHCTSSAPISFSEVNEHPGLGLSARHGDDEIRLGSREWVGIAQDYGAHKDNDLEMWIKVGEKSAERIRFRDQLRRDAPEIINELRQLGYDIHLLSGDRIPVAKAVAGQLGIDAWQGECRPDAKLAYLESLREAGRKVLMVGDGLNDGPALAAGFASMSPATASDVSQIAADVIFQGEQLAPVWETLRIAGQANRLVKQNFILAFAYNAVAIPIAVLGFATPLVAAVAMSSSSIAVTLNAIRLRVMSSKFHGGRR